MSLTTDKETLGVLVANATGLPVIWAVRQQAPGAKTQPRRTGQRCELDFSQLPRSEGYDTQEWPDAVAETGRTTGPRIAVMDVRFTDGEAHDNAQGFVDALQATINRTAWSAAGWSLLHVGDPLDLSKLVQTEDEQVSVVSVTVQKIRTITGIDMGIMERITGTVTIGPDGPTVTIDTDE